VENVFKHGLQTISKDSFAHFSLSVQGKDLFFEAKNSSGKSLENSPESGRGIANLRKRLQLIYPNNHLLDIQKSNDEYKVVLHIQL
jgi:LytS/YehU family sensor histidine kinase